MFSTYIKNWFVVKFVTKMEKYTKFLSFVSLKWDHLDTCFPISEFIVLIKKWKAKWLHCVCEIFGLTLTFQMTNTFRPLCIQSKKKLHEKLSMMKKGNATFKHVFQSFSENKKIFLVISMENIKCVHYFFFFHISCFVLIFTIFLPLSE